MATEIVWKDKIYRDPPPLYFDDLEYKECFVVDTLSSKGAVYMKVSDRSNNDRNFLPFKQLELATGFIFDPTSSPIKRVDVKVEIDCEMPEIYREEIPF